MVSRMLFLMLLQMKVVPIPVLLKLIEASLLQLMTKQTRCHLILCQVMMFLLRLLQVLRLQRFVSMTRAPGAKQTCDWSERNKHPSCRKRLLQEPADAVKASLPDKDFQEQVATAQSLDDTHVDTTINSALVGKTPVEKKRSRGASSMLQESG